MRDTGGPTPEPMRAVVRSSRLRVGPACGATVTLTQCDSTTCGAACILAARLLRGLGPGARGPRSTPGGPPGAGGPLPGRDLVARLAHLQRVVQTRMNQHGLGLLPWPSRLGSAPWSVATAMTRAWDQAGTVYVVRPVRDEGERWHQAVERVRALLGQGLPVILLAGGPLTTPQTAPQTAPDSGGPVGRALGRALSAGPVIPRHYVLAMPWALIGRTDPGAGRVPIYEPGSGTVRALDLLAPRARRGRGPRELGSWPRVLALIAPCEVEDA